VKYMGSKRVMLTNGLGEMLNLEVPKATRFVDMFLGTAEVASFVAQRHAIPVYGVDLQSYSVVLADAVIARSEAVQWYQIWKNWRTRAVRIVETYDPPVLSSGVRITRGFVAECRKWSVSVSATMSITQAYGGHYFSPSQAVWIDAFRASLPSKEPNRTVALAALIRASSLCVASPGHTAQPFQPTKTARVFLQEAWLRDVSDKVRDALKGLSWQHGKKVGKAGIGDANEVADGLAEGDLVFLDPPYSGVQYSRFYHVLETIAKGQCGQVKGVGRYPLYELRPTSKYSMVSKSQEALDELLSRIAQRGARAILTFPDHQCSNGLSGDDVRDIASTYFKVKEKSIASRFSTLGGRGAGTDKVAKRNARQDASELMLLMNPK